MYLDKYGLMFFPIAGNWKVIRSADAFCTCLMICDSYGFKCGHLSLYTMQWFMIYYLIYLTLHWPFLMNNPLIFVTFTLLYNRGVPFVINKYCSYQLSSIPVKYHSGIGVWLRCVWFGFNPPVGNVFFQVKINKKCAKHAQVFLQAR